MTAESVRDQRIARLTEARSRDSEIKRRRALRACEELVAAGLAVTHANVARKAHVSAWLTYNVRDIRNAIVKAQADQARDGIAAKPGASPNLAASRDSLRTDLLLARQHLKELREENRKLRTRLAKQLGSEVERTSSTELLERISALEREARTLRTEITSRDKLIADQRDQITQLERELEGRSDALRAMMLAKNVHSD